LGQAYLEGYQAIKGDVWAGAQPSEVKLVMGAQKVLSTETVNLFGEEYTVERYEDKDLYYSAKGFEFVNVTKPLMKEDVLGLAMEAYLKGASLGKGSDAAEALNKIHDHYTSDAWTAYMLNDAAKAGALFEAAVASFDNPVLSKKDTSAIYYAAVLSNAAGNKDKAKKYYNECFALGYDQDGNGHSTMSEILKAEGDIEGAKAVLNEGFQKYPSSQAILVSLINLYMTTKDDPNKILDLIHSAQANEPKNPSLYYAEGNVYKELGDIDKAVELYYKSMEINPKYVFGVYEVGNLYLNKAVEIQTSMDALDINDVKGYEKLRVEFDETLKKCIPPFEQAFAGSDSADLKKAVAQALKQVYYVFREEGDEYKAGYEKYNAYISE